MLNERSSRVMVIKKVNLDIVVGVTSTLTETPFHEVAFADKYQVGH